MWRSNTNKLAQSAASFDGQIIGYITNAERDLIFIKRIINFLLIIFAEYLNLLEWELKSFILAVNMLQE